MHILSKVQNELELYNICIEKDENIFEIDWGF